METLEQDEINKIIAKQQKIDNAMTAREKIAVIYESATGMELDDPLETMEEIGAVITLIRNFISSDDDYIKDFERLESSFERKIK